MPRILFVVSVVLVVVLVVSRVQSSQVPEVWPPQVGQTYPDLSLKNHRGETINIAQFRGKVLLIEPVGMDCRACQAFSGADQWGSFGGVHAQQDLPSVQTLASRYGNGVSLDDPNIVFIQILFYGMDRQGPPSMEEASEWARHFRLGSSPNHHVLVGTAEFISPETYRMIPGFQLIDKRGVLQFDSTGHNPRHNLYSDLCPELSSYLDQ